MTEKIEYVKFIVAALPAFFADIFGATSKQVFVLLILIAADTGFGWAKAIKNNSWKRRKAKIGFMGKIVELMFVACLYALDWLFCINTLKYIGVYYFIICELSSVVENYAQINGNLPEGLIEILGETKKNFAQKITNAVRNIINEEDINDKK